MSIIACSRFVRDSSAWAGALLCAVAVLFPGCASTKPSSGAGAPPSDAMLSVTVMPQRPRFQRPEREFAPARYIVEADGVLRAAVGDGVTVQTYPGRTRDLTTEEWATLWQALLATGVLNLDDPRAIEGEMSLNPDPLRRAVVWANGNGRSAGMVVDPSRDEATAALVTLLEEMAWIRTPWEMSGEQPVPASERKPMGDPPPRERDMPFFPLPEPSEDLEPGEIPPDSPDPFAPGM
jgi:hypothetical protein